MKSSKTLRHLDPTTTSIEMSEMIYIYSIYHHNEFEIKQSILNQALSFPGASNNLDIMT